MNRVWIVSIEFLWLEDKTFSISTTNSELITDSILRDIQMMARLTEWAKQILSSI